MNGLRYILLLLLLGLTYPQNTFAELSGQIGFTQKGLASFYSDQFQGRMTACGERYDRKALTAAHRELPFGAMVKVTNLKNNKVVIVRINDRGPFRSNRIIDLSRAAAQKIGLIAGGVGMVTIEVVGYQGVKQEPKLTPPKTPIEPVQKKQVGAAKKNLPQPKPKPIVKIAPFTGTGTFDAAGNKLKLGEFGVQLASFSNLEGAKEMLDDVKRHGYNQVFIHIAQSKSKAFEYRVVVGKYQSIAIARQNIAELRQKGLPKGFPVKHL